VHARFYAPDAHATGDLVALPDDEARHLTRVLRLKAGAAVRAFDGRGHEFEAVVEDASARGVRVRLGAARSSAPERRTPVTLAQAALKGDKMDDVVRDATTIGVTAIQPVVSARSETALETLLRGRRRDRWERVAVAAAKQCGRAVVPRILAPCALTDLWSGIDAASSPAAFMFVEPGGSADAMRLRDLPQEAPESALVLVGPEGGWTVEEIAASRDRCRAITFRGPTLRADAMAVVGVTALFTRWDEL
jgi:16S rRNA (uracil1498-N3)-methyltransferase